ncbi:MAG: glycosyltransferase [Polyangiales bacterium]
MDLDLPSFLSAAALLSSGLCVIATFCAWLTVRRRSTLEVRTGLPPISLLKPVKGLEEDLERCLRSFYDQDYDGPREVVFASTERDDPALAVARRVAEDFPGVVTRYVLTDPDYGYNPKVSNMAGALAAATHDLVLQSDANVWVPRDYLSRIVSELENEKASVLSSLVSGTGEESHGAALENLQLSAFVAPACCFALETAGIPCVIGKSILFRKSELAAHGGLEPYKDVLAEDFLLGRTFAEAGKKVVLSATPVYNLNVKATFQRFFERHSRWLKMRAVIHTPAFLADLLESPTPLLVLAFVASGFELRMAEWLAVAVLAKAGLDAISIRLVRGHAMELRHLVVSPLRDLFIFGIWFYAAFARTVTWRGVRLRMGHDSTLSPWEPNGAEKLLRRLVGA